MNDTYLGIPRHSASWKFLWIFYTMLAVLVSFILAFSRPFSAILATTSDTGTVYDIVWWKYGVNLVVMLMVLVVIPHSLRYLARHMHRKNNLGNGPTDAGK